MQRSVNTYNHVPLSVLDLFEKHVHQAPTSPALILENGHVFSYQVLNALAEAVGKEAACATKGTSTDEAPLVGVMVTRGVGLVAAILGILKSGSAYVPVDPKFPPDRQTYIFGQAKLQLLITDAECFEQALSLGVKVPPTLVLNLTAMQPNGLVGNVIQRSLHLPSFDGYDKLNLMRTGRAQVANRIDGGLMYVLYTSGSTGKPKGVMVKHRGVTSQMLWFAEELQIGPHSRILGLATICFDISVLEMYLSLIRGAATIHCLSATQKDPYHLLHLIRSHGCTVMQATPTTYDMLFAIGWTGDSTIDFLVGGEAFRPSLAILAHNSKSLRNIYGPTETTIWASSFLVPRDINSLGFHNGMPVVPVGMPIANVDFYVVQVTNTEDEDHNNYLLSAKETSSSSSTQNGSMTYHNAPPRLVGEGEEGELWIGGIGVSLGYLNQPDLTQKVFVPNPFSTGYVYKTGDLVKRLEKGKGPYHFIRRIDNQVKVDGFRIELSEIEYVFATHPLVHQCVVILKDNKLVLYLKHRGADRLLRRDQIEDIRTHSARSLMYYMMPKIMVQVTGFIETPSGKIDRKLLPEPHDVANKAGTEAVYYTGGGDEERNEEGHDDTLPRFAPKSPPATGEAAMAYHICTIIEKVRGRRPNPNTSFATVGVDSLGAVMFIKQLSDSFGGIHISPSKIYTPGVTIKSFAKELYDRLSLENPSVLIEQLGRFDVMGGPTDEETGGGGNDGEDEDEEEEYEGEKIVRRLDTAFEDLLVSNRNLIEGFRGIFSFLVLYDHFHNPKDLIAESFQVDIYLFVMISGFTTAFQLRETPRFSPGRTRGLVRLLPRPRLELWKFMSSRLVGLLPIMWIALILHLPPWVAQFYSGVGTPASRTMCPVFLLYASLLVNVFLIYALGRKYVIEPVQATMMKWASEEVHPLTLQPPESVKTSRSWKQWVGDLTVLLAYNRTQVPLMLLMCVVWCIFSYDFFWLMLHYTFAKNAPVFVPYFLVGVGSAACLESVHFAFWEYNLRGLAALKNDKFKTKADGIIGFINRVLHHSSSSDYHSSRGGVGQAWPWVHNNVWLTLLYPSAISTTTRHLSSQPSTGPSVPPKSILSSSSSSGDRDRDRSVQFNLLRTSDPHDLPMKTDHDDRDDGSSSASMAVKVSYYIWRFFPDVLAIAIGLLMAPFKATWEWQGWLWFVGMPAMYMALIFVMMLQKGSARFNFSRLILESTPVTTMGYSSYALYLFQRIVFTFYLPLVYLGTLRGYRYGMDIGDGDPNGGPWFEQLPNLTKFFCVVGLTLVAWQTHKHFQDRFVTWVYTKYLR